MKSTFANLLTSSASSPAAKDTASSAVPLDAEGVESFFRGSRVLVVSYHLPVKLFITRDGAGPVSPYRWIAQWDEGSFISRSPGHSIADDLNTVWVGCVTNQCFDVVSG